MWTWPDCVRRRGWDPSQKVAGPDEGQVDSIRQETCTRLVQETACEDAVAAYVDAAGFLFKTVKEDNKCKTISTVDAVYNRTMTLEYEFEGVKARGTEDLHNKLKYHQVISNEQITTDNAKPQR